MNIGASNWSINVNICLVARHSTKGISRGKSCHFYFSTCLISQKCNTVKSTGNVAASIFLIADYGGKSPTTVNQSVHCWKYLYSINLMKPAVHSEPAEQRSDLWFISKLLNSRLDEGFCFTNKIKLNSQSWWVLLSVWRHLMPQLWFDIASSEAKLKSPGQKVISHGTLCSCKNKWYANHLTLFAYK